VAGLLAVVVTAGGAAGCSASPSGTAEVHRSPARSEPTPAPSTTTSEPSATPTTVTAPVQTTPGWTGVLTTLPPGGGFSSLSCISDTFCVAVGGGTDFVTAPGTGNAPTTTGAGATVSWDGASWSEPSVYLPAPASVPVTAPVLPSISCSAGPSCTIVDGSGQVSSGDGTNWAAPSPLASATGFAANPADPGPGHAGARSAWVSCPNVTFCAAVDNTGHTYTRSGSHWLTPQAFAEPSGRVSLYQTGRVGITCANSSFCTAVVGDTALDWDGTAWSEEAVHWTTAPPAGPTAIACPTTQLCAIVSGPRLWVRKGAQGWAPAGNIDPGGTLDAIACPAATFCLASDTGGRVLSWDGSNWSAPRQVVPPAVEYTDPGTSLSCPTASFCMVMNGDGDYATFSGSGAPPG
jgi:hypothetical protein